jgi:predicted amidohydrolase
VEGFALNNLTIVRIEPWAPHPTASPLTERNGDELAVSSNGTRTCVGGWQIIYSGIVPGRRYAIRWDTRYTNIDHARDNLRGKLYWEDLAADTSRPKGDWHYLLPETESDGVIFRRTLIAPVDANHLTIRSTFRWSPKGEAVWTMPQIEELEPIESQGAIRVAVVTGTVTDRRQKYETIQDNIDLYLPLCREAIEAGAQLICLPEIALQYGMNGHALDVAIPLESPETEPFAKLARETGTRILLGLFERDGDAVHNTAALLGPSGIEGRYHKVHLAVGGESESGILPGDGFPVFKTDLGRIGCNICMDSSAAESARSIGLAGADFLLLPIMGDHRADRWSKGHPVFNESRWKAIMRTRAIDSQLCMVVARNTSQGSCIIDRKGDILAWNEGDDAFIIADVSLEDGYRTWNGGCFTDVNWMQRRPHIYAEYANEENVGSLTS